MQTLLLLLAAFSLPQETPPASAATQLHRAAGFEVLSTVEVGKAPHGMAFSADGRFAYLALSGDDDVLVLDCETLQPVRRLPAGSVPLDVLRVGDGGELIVTQFRSTSLISILADGSTGPQTWEVGKGPSLFGPRVLDGRAFLSCEFEDRFVVVDTSARSVGTSFDTGKQPYPGDVTRDGILAFVPNRGAGSVTVIDLLNGEVLKEVAVGEKPEGGCLLQDDTAYVAACGGSDELVWINTASFEVVQRTPSVGPRPFSVTATTDGRFLLVNNAGGDTLSIVDVASRALIGAIAVGEQPICVRMHPDGRRAFVSNEKSGTLSVVSLPPAPKRPAATKPNEVVVLGMIHGGHLTSESYGLDLLRALVREIAPDYVLTEIPPNRAREAMRGFLQDGVVTEARVSRFPEYKDVLYPMLAEGKYEIIPTAGWTAPMARFRGKQLSAISEDPARAADWKAYEEANADSDACMEALGASDDPWLIHTDSYDECVDVGLGVYDELFNDELGPGGWTNINEAHYALIAAALDRHQGEGKRILITYGAGHKGWFLRELRTRTDIDLIEVDPFLKRAQETLQH